MMYLYVIFVLTFVCIANADDSTITPKRILLLCTTDKVEEPPICRCRTDPAESYSILMDCKNASLEHQMFENEILPPFTELLDLSYNHFEYIPSFQSDDLLTLDLSHNSITTIDDRNFERIPWLRKLNLSWNQIFMLSIDAFVGLTHLTELDLSRNKLHAITVNVFSTMPQLIRLDLSRNRGLNKTFSSQNVDLFLTLGVTPKLRHLHIEESDLTTINLSYGGSLEELHLRYNHIEVVPDIPRSVRLIDLSGNPVRELKAKFLPHLNELRVLKLQDMPALVWIHEFAFIGLPKLEQLTLEGSWNLGRFDEDAFGDVNMTNLEELILSGTNLKSVNNSRVFGHLKSLQLLGAPVECGCGAEWILERNLNTNAECAEPEQLRGRQLVHLRVEDLVCRRWPSWVYTLLNGLVVFLLLVLCVGATWLLVARIGVSRKVQLRKVGENSPYARVTIEPNRADNDRFM